MLYGAEVAICPKINTKHVVWEECTVLKYYTCWCTKPVGSKGLR